MGLLCACAVTASGCTDVNAAHIRLLNLSADYSPLDMYLGDTRILDGVKYDSPSAYVEVDPDTYTVKFNKNGVTSSLISASHKFSKKSYVTFVAYGATGQFATLEIDENQSIPDSGEINLQLLNAAVAAGTVDVYLTDASTSLDDASPIFNDVSASTTASEGWVSMDSGTYRLRVTATGSKSDVRLDISNVQLTSKEVASIVLGDTTGGVLVNAALVPQQSAIVIDNNPSARVRAVVGINEGKNVTVEVGSASLLSSAPATTVGSYQLVDAGTQPVSLTIDGAAVAVADAALTAGSDATLLIYDMAADAQVAIISDDNRPPSSDYAKVRVVNAMSGLAEPISLAVDYTALATDVPLGAASAAAQIGSGSDSQIDVTDTSTSSILYTQSSVAFAGAAVYSVFMFGSSSSPTAVLRKDR